MVNTTFLPKTNLTKPFDLRLTARENKGRIPAMGTLTVTSN
tara:strand:+ start:143 stop:265 length:123 start_codon:yes stop_codon:yes gene_type:complete